LSSGLFLIAGQRMIFHQLPGATIAHQINLSGVEGSPLA
jgi:hypothetical protein